MATKKQVVVLPTKLYRILRNDVGSKLGPHKVFTQGDVKVVALNEKQAKFYLTQGTIIEV